jgi:NAD(P)H dehydrogenase (quinone)
MKTNYESNFKHMIKVILFMPFVLWVMICGIGSDNLLAKETGKVLVVYYSKTGFTKQMALAVVEGVKKVPGVQVRILSVNEAGTTDVLWADGIIVGSPVYNAATAPPVQQFINSWPFNNAPMKDKIGAAFVTGAGISAGEELAQLNILRSMLVFGMIVVGGNDWQSPFGASAVTEEKPFDEYFKIKKVAPQFLKKASDLGERVATLVAKLK